MTTVLLGFGLIALTALLMGVGYAVRREVRLSWAIGLLGLLIAAADLFLWRGRVPVSQVLTFWDAGVREIALVVFLDLPAWKVALAMEVLVLAAWLQAALETPDSRWWRWLLWLGVLLAVWGAALAANGIVLVLAWTAFDALDLALSLTEQETEALPSAWMRALVLRAVSLYVVLWGSLATRSVGNPLTFSVMPPALAQAIWLAVGLRWVLGGIPGRPRGRGSTAVRQGALLLSGAVPLARTTTATFSHAEAGLGLTIAMFAALMLWWMSAGERWLDGWTVALGGTLWALTPWLSADTVLPAAALIALSGALFSWLNVRHRLINAGMAILLALVVAFPWVPWPLWRIWPGGALLALGSVSWGAAAAQRRMQASRDPIPAVRVERAFWHLSLGTLLLTLGGLSVRRIVRHGFPASLPVIALSLLWIWLNGRPFAHGYGERLEQVLRRLQADRWESRLWRWAASGWQRLVGTLEGAFEGAGGVLWGLLGVLIFLVIAGGGG